MLDFDRSRVDGGTLTVVEPPEREAFELDEVKLYLRVQHDVEDALIGGMIVAARERLEMELNRPLLPQTCEVRVDAFPSWRLLLWQDVLEVASVQYRDVQGEDQTLDGDAWQLVNRAHLESVSGWPGGDEIRVTFRCGAFDRPESVPQSLRQWMQLQIGTLYAQRQSEGPQQTYSIPSRYVDGLIDRYRIPVI